ncbi:MAG: PAS domain S-box protein [Candidatus Erginobacter occultus]|nr:PAS domain S-box protein [Candidatus Erginobacter occultus]
MPDKIRQLLLKPVSLGRLVLENVLVGTLMGALVGVVLRGYLRYLNQLELDWAIFILVGLLIGLFSGFARQSHQQLKLFGDKMTTTLRRSQKQLVSTEERYKNLLDQANDLIFLLDEKSCFVEMNGKFEDILGYRRDEWLGRSFYDLVPGNFRDEAIKYCWETLKGGTPRFELETIRADGRVISLALANSPVRNADGEITGIMGIARDISESKKLEELQNKFVSHVSHELRTPLTAMGEFISLMLDEIPGELNDTQKDYCKRVGLNIERLTRIIENLLLISRVDEGKIILEKELVDLGELVGQVKDTMAPTAARGEVALETEIEAALPRIYADPNRISQVITNLVANALKFTPKNGRVTIGVRDRETSVELLVRDTGVGISPQDQDRIFDRFQQIRHRPTFGGGGTGLGLAISREIVFLHRGSIRVESEVGAGSVFSVTLPKALAPRVLLVDDDPDLIEMYKDFLGPLHYRVSVAYNGAEAVKLALEENPDLIILDIVMPQMNGYEVLGRLKQNQLTCNIPVIILTGYGLDQNRMGMLGKDILPALRKPISMNEFVSAVVSVLEKDAKPSKPINIGELIENEQGN